MNLLGLVQQFNSLVPSALVDVEQTELHQSVRHQVVVEPDLLFTEHTQKEGGLTVTVMYRYISHTG